jgi:hypothetical protein
MVKWFHEPRSWKKPSVLSLEVHLGSVLFYFVKFVSELAYININREFHNFTNEYSVLWKSLLPPLFSLTLLSHSLFSKTVWWAWFSCLQIFMYCVLISFTPVGFYFWNNLPLCRPHWHQTRFPPLSESLVLELLECTTMPGSAIHHFMSTSRPASRAPW